MQSKIIESLRRAMPRSEILENVPLSTLTSFRIGGPAALVVRPASQQELCRGLALAEELALPLRVLGNGTNVLCPDAGFDGVVFRLDTPAWPPVFQGNAVTAHAAQPLSSLAGLALKAGLSGLEGLSGIPGTVGGAVAMNAGAYGTETADRLQRVCILRRGAVTEENVRREAFGFRKSPYTAPGCVVLWARFLLAPDDGTGAERMAEFGRRRSEKQPLADPSAGSVFKRPQGYYAGSLIEQAGLKGFGIGGAMVSPLHAGFIVNAGNATEKDVLALIEHIQSRVYAMSGVHLERELKLLSEL